MALILCRINTKLLCEIMMIHGEGGGRGGCGDGLLKGLCYRIATMLLVFI